MDKGSCNDIKPEEAVELKLWDWLEPYPGREVQFYFNRKNKLDWQTFNTKGKGGKPDVIISFINKFKGKQHIAVEVKDGNTNRNIFDAYKIFNTYYLNYINRKTKYFIDNQEIKIDYFIVATQFSPYGKLFLNDKRIIDNINKGENDIWRSMSAKNKTLPRCEYENTRNYLRSLWGMFREWRKKNETLLKPGLGILESDILKIFSPQELKIQSGMKGKPLISVMSYRYITKKKKSQWMQTLIKIGEEDEK